MYNFGDGDDCNTVHRICYYSVPFYRLVDETSASSRAFSSSSLQLTSTATNSPTHMSLKLPLSFPSPFFYPPSSSPSSHPHASHTLTQPYLLSPHRYRIPPTTPPLHNPLPPPTSKSPRILSWSFVNPSADSAPPLCLPSSALY